MTGYERAMQVIDEQIISPNRTAEDCICDLLTIKEEIDIRIEAMECSQ